MSRGHDFALNEDQEVSAGRPGPLHRFTDLSVRYVEKWMPDPYLFAVILTLLVVALIFAFVPGASLGGVVDGWYKGVWGEGNIFTFAMQMILILVGGYTLAEAPIVKRGLQWLASKPKNQAQGGLLCFGVAALACLVNWGLGLVVGALLARQVFARLRTVNFAYLVAAGYMGYMVWTGGLSSSIALANTDKLSKLNIIWTQTHQLVPLSDTIFRPYSFVPMLVLAVVIGFLVYRMSPRPQESTEEADVDLEALLALDQTPAAARPGGPLTMAERLENLWILNVLVFVAGAVVLRAERLRPQHRLDGHALLHPRCALPLDTHPFHPGVHRGRQDRRTAPAAVPALWRDHRAAGLHLALRRQPASDGHRLGDRVARDLLHVAAAELHCLRGDLAVRPLRWRPLGRPGSGRRQRGRPAGPVLPAYLGKISMSVANGEAVANMIQPFWLLPVLAIAKLNIRRVMGFTVVAFVVGFVVLGIGSLLMPLLP